MEKAKGIDVSHWQGRIDFDKVKSQGYSFVMINAGYGKYISQKDENFEKNYAAARKAGLNIGTYWYSYALTEADALAEAKTFLEAVKGKMFEYPLSFDIEDASQSELPNAAINKIIEVFCDYLESNGYYAAVYSYANFFKRKVSDSVKSRYDIWVAHFDVAKPAISNYGMWQYTSKGTVNGVSDRCDCNYAYKDYPAIMKKKCLNLYPSNAKNLDTTGYKKGDKGNGVLALKYLLMLAKKKGMHEILQRRHAGGLALVAVDGGGGDSLLVQIFCNFIGSVLGAAEHQRVHHLRLQVFDEPGQQELLVALLHKIQALLDAVHRAGHRVHLDKGRVMQDACGQLLDLLGHSGAEHQVLALPGQLGDHLFHVVDKAHIQHPVGFVQNKDLNVGKVQQPLPHQVVQAARAGNEDVHTLFQGCDLRSLTHTAKDDGAAQGHPAAALRAMPRAHCPPKRGLSSP